MKTHTGLQGTPEWLALRSNYFTASEASAMMGASKYQTRDQLMSQKKYGIEEEITPQKQALFDRGHAAEAAIRPVIEKLIGKTLYPVTGSIEVDGLKLLASFDGLDMMETVNFEHKLYSAKLAAMVQAVNEGTGELDPHYTWQLEQQMMVSGAEKSIFVVSDGTEENMVYCWYEPVPSRRDELIAGWKQFRIDLESHEHIEQAAPVVAESQDTLPAVYVNVEGSIAIIDNLGAFGEALTAYVEKINQKPETDQDFANLESAVKTLKTAEDALDYAENNALSQAESIDAMRRSVSTYRDMARNNRLIIEKLVKSEKESRRAEIVNNGGYDLQKHIDSLNESLNENYIKIGDVGANFAGVVKGKKTITSIRSAVNDELARVKILANEIADGIRANQKYLNTNAAEYMFLFNDIRALINKPSDDFQAIVKLRISEHKEVEQKKIVDAAQLLADQKAEDERKAAEQKPVEKKAEPMSEENQQWVADYDSAPAVDAKPVSKAAQKKIDKERDTDIKAMRKHFDSILAVPVPSVSDIKCQKILTRAVEKLTEIADYIDKEFPA